MSNYRYPHARNVWIGIAGPAERWAMSDSDHLITAHGDEKMRMQALKAGAVEFLAKPFDDEVLLENVRAAL